MDIIAVSECLQFLNGKIPEDKIFIVQEKLVELDFSYYEKIFKLKLINPLTVVLCSTFLGFLATDRFYLKDYKIGLLKLCFNIFTLGIWGIIDIPLCLKKTKKINYEMVKNFLKIKEEI